MSIKRINDDGKPLKISNIDDLSKSFNRFELTRGARPKVILTSQGNQEKLAAWFESVALTCPDPIPIDKIDFRGVIIVNPREVMII